MERFFQILAVILIGVAAYFLWRGDRDATFIAAVFGAVSFFLSIRFQVKGRLKEREAERLAREAAEFESEDDEETSEPTESLHEIPASGRIEGEPRSSEKERI